MNNRFYAANRQKTWRSWSGHQSNEAYYLLQQAHECICLLPYSGRHLCSDTTQTPYPKISLLQKIISLVLYAGHASLLLHTTLINLLIMLIVVQVHERLCRQNLTTSYSYLLSVVDKMGVNHDARVLEWWDALVTKVKSTNLAQVSEYLSCVCGPKV